MIPVIAAAALIYLAAALTLGHIAHPNRINATRPGTAQQDRNALKGANPMSAHPLAFQRIADQLAVATDPDHRNELLDEWLDIRDRATEWDASRWGFDPDRWCEIERAAMNRRAATEEPTR